MGPLGGGGRAVAAMPIRLARPKALRFMYGFLCEGVEHRMRSA